MRTPIKNERERVVRLLKGGGARELFKDEKFEEHIAVALRVTLESGDFLREQQLSSRSWEEISELRDNIRSALDSFEYIETIMDVIQDIQFHRLPWSRDWSWSALAEDYELELKVLLQGTEVLAQQRLGALARLIRLLLVLWGITFGGSSRGYVG